MKYLILFLAHAFLIVSAESYGFFTQHEEHKHKVLEIFK